jgi:hypothetical protein
VHSSPSPLEAKSLSELESELPAPTQRDHHSTDLTQQQLSSPCDLIQAERVESDQDFSRADEDSDNWKSLVVACSKSQLPRLKSAIAQADPALHCVRSDGCTLLHIAAAAGSWRVVDLLIDAAVSPLPRDKRRKSAYDVSKDKATRDSFRKGM